LISHSISQSISRCLSCHTSRRSHVRPSFGHRSSNASQMLWESEGAIWTHTGP
jgi:hypothetical protein